MNLILTNQALYYKYKQLKKCNTSKGKITMEKSIIEQIFNDLGIQNKNYGATTGSADGWLKTSGRELVSFSPIDGQGLATVVQATRKEYETIMVSATAAFERFRMMPAPKRGQIVREIAMALRAKRSRWAPWLPWRRERSNPKAWGKSRR